MSKKKKPTGPLPLPESIGLPCLGAETHAHLDLQHFENDLDAVLRRAKNSGVANLGQVFMGPEAWRKGQSYFADNPDYPRVFFLLGIHPTDGLDFTDAVLEDMRRAVRQDSRIRAIGEIGLDYYWDDCPPAKQQEVFVKMLGLAREVKLPVAIHCREAVEDTIRILLDEGFKNYPLLWHCFNGDSSLAQRVVDLGWHVSIPGPVSFPANKALREALSLIPPDRIMVETDCPYMAPMPYRGQRNEPAYLAFTISSMAEALDLNPTELWTRCGDNARRFFGVV